MFTVRGDLDKKEIKRTGIAISLTVRRLRRGRSCIKFSEKRLKKG